MEEQKNNHGFTRKTMVSIIKNKINQWVNTIENEQLRQDIHNSYILTGGAIASMLTGNMPNDFDIYFDNTEVCAAVARYYVDKYLEKASVNKLMCRITVLPMEDRVEIQIKSSGVIGDDINPDAYDFFELTPAQEDVEEDINQFLGNPEIKEKDKGQYKAVMITSNAISLTDDIQIITRFVGNIEYIHNNFDYVHATNYYSEKTGLVLNTDALESILTKELKYIGSLYPLASLFRLRKFVSRGWTINVGEIIKISWDINKLNLNGIDVLKDQLTGVDVAYCTQLIKMLSKFRKEGGELDRSYLINLIDRIF